MVPASVKVIEAESFAFCDGLKEAYISDKTQVAENAFAWCDNISIIRYTGDIAGDMTQ